MFELNTLRLSTLTLGLEWLIKLNIFTQVFHVGIFLRADKYSYKTMNRRRQLELQILFI